MAFIKANMFSKFAYSSHSIFGYGHLDSNINIVPAIFVSLITVLPSFWFLRVAHIENAISIGFQKWIVFCGRALQLCALLFWWLIIPVGSLYLDPGTI
jgi:hypothetical protein